MSRKFFTQFITFEAIFITFLFAGIFTNHPFFDFIDINLTILLMIINAILIFVLYIDKQWKFTAISIVLMCVYGVFLVYATVSIIWSPSTIYASSKLLRLWTVVPLVIMGSIVIGQSHVRLNRFLRLLVLLSTVFSVIFIYNHISGMSGPVVEGSSYLLPSRAMGAGALIILYWFSNANSRFAQFAALSLIITHILGILLSGARGALIALLLAVGIYLVLQIRYTQENTIILTYTIRKIFSLGVVSLVGIAASIRIFSIEISSIPAISRTMRLFSETQTETSLIGRMEYYQSALQMWLDSPILGHGIGSFGVLHTGVDKQLYPHNIILEILAELGMVGIILFSLIVFVVVYRVYKYRIITDYTVRSFIIAFGVFWFAAAWLSFDLSGNRYLFMSLGLLCISEDVLEQLLHQRTGNT